MAPTFALFFLGMAILPVVCFTIAGAFYPVIRILKRLGFPQWHVVLYFLPPINLIFIWRLAFRDWPIDAQDDVKGLAHA